MNTVGSTTVDIKKTLLHYIKAEFKEKDLDMLKSLLGSIYTELTNTPDILPHLESPNFAADPLDCCDRTNSDTITDTPSFSPDNLKPYQDFLIDIFYNLGIVLSKFLHRKITINSWKKAVALKKERLTL